MATAAKRIARLKRIDRAAVFIITLGGLSVVVAVLGILVFIGWEALPMFRSAAVIVRPAVTLASASGAQAPGMRAAGVDEYGRYLSSIEPDGTLLFRSLADGSVRQVDKIAGLETGGVVSSSRSVLGDYFAAGTADGRVALLQVQYAQQYEQQTLSGLAITVRDRGLIALDPGKRPILQVDYHEENDERLVVAVVGDRELLFWRGSEAGATRSTGS